jgi:hypothetical protein
LLIESIYIGQQSVMNTYGSASFPLENRDQYKGQIRFIPIITTPPSINEKVRTATTEAGNSSDGQAPGGATRGGIFGDGLRGNGGQTLTSDREAVINRSRESRRLDEQVVLYMPPSVAIFDGVNIQNVDFGAFGAGVEMGLNAGSGPIQALVSSTETQISSFMDALSGNLDPEGARVVASRTASMFGSDAVSGAVSSALRVTPNPNTRMIFRSVNIREFAFNFKMIPTSQAESQAIKRIIHLFRKNLYPKTIDLEGAGIPIAYRFPNTFEIEMYYGGKKLSELNPDLKLGKMYLRQFTANYNPNGMGFYKNGDFNEVDISLSFTETRALTYDDVASEGEAFRDNLFDQTGSIGNVGGR